MHKKENTKIFKTPYGHKQTRNFNKYLWGKILRISLISITVGKDENSEEKMKSATKRGKEEKKTTTTKTPF